MITTFSAPRRSCAQPPTPPHAILCILAFGRCKGGDCWGRKYDLAGLAPRPRPGAWPLPCFSTTRQLSSLRCSTCLQAFQWHARRKCKQLHRERLCARTCAPASAMIMLGLPCLCSSFTQDFARVSESTLVMSYTMMAAAAPLRTHACTTVTCKPDTRQPAAWLLLETRCLQRMPACCPDSLRLLAAHHRSLCLFGCL